MTKTAKKEIIGFASIITPAQKKGATHDWAGYNKRQRNGLVKGLAICVLLPTLLATMYFGFIAADQYQTEAHLSVRSQQQTAVPNAFGALLTGMSGLSQSVQDVRSIAEYLQSHDAVLALQETVDLRAMLANPKADFLTAMPRDVSIEQLIKYYNKHVKIVFNTDTSSVMVYVRAYTPQDAEKLTDAIVSLSETTINSFNRRAEEDALRLAREELAYAEKRVTDTRAKIIAFREVSEDIDPTSKSGSILTTIAQLETDRNASQVQLRELQSYAAKSTPQSRTLQRRVNALDQQINQEQSRLTGTGDTYTKKLSQYEELMMEQELVQQAYASALISLENARLEAQRQKSYVVPIVRAHTPQEAVYPQRLRGVMLAFLASLLGFGIIRLIIAGVRDHVMH